MHLILQKIVDKSKIGAVDYTTEYYAKEHKRLGSNLFVFAGEKIADGLDTMDTIQYLLKIV